VEVRVLSTAPLPKTRFDFIDFFAAVAAPRPQLLEVAAPVIIRAQIRVSVLTSGKASLSKLSTI
jgi:hypothetical protein